MPYFAKVVENIVEEVRFTETDINEEGLWLETSKDVVAGVHYGEDGLPDGLPAIRKNFAMVGWSYNADLDAFIPPKPFESWLFNSNTCCWDPLVPFPNDNKIYRWNEEIKNWELLK